MKKKGCLIAGIAVGIILIGIISIVLWYIKTGNKIVKIAFFIIQIS